MSESLDFADRYAMVSVVLWMVTYSDLIQIGILIVGIIGLFIQTTIKEQIC